MSSVSQYLASQGLDPFFVGLLGGALATGLVAAVRRAGRRAAGDPFTASAPTASAPASRTTQHVHFRVRIGGQDHALTDAQTAAVLAAIKSGDPASAVGAVREGLAVSPEVAQQIVDALKATHLP